jgi:hypothetical protein
MHRDTFSPDFYITAATVIPVLFIALTFQSPAYDSFLQWLVKNIGKGLWLAGPIAIALAGICLYAGGAEVAALAALLHRTSSHNQGQYIYQATWTLTVVVVAVPMLRYLFGVGKAGWEVFRDGPSGPPLSSHHDGTEDLEHGS